MSPRAERPARWWRLWRMLRQDGVASTSLAVLCFFLLVSVAAPMIAPQDPYDPLNLDILNAELPPFWRDGAVARFALGTDSQGRDMLSAMLFGLGTSLIIGLGAVIVQALLGIAIGLAAGYTGGRLDSLLMRLADIQLSFSTLMVAIVALAVFQAVFGSDQFGTYAILLLILVIGMAEWPQFARTVRACVLAEKAKDYVLAAEALGLPAARIVTRHILPNVLSPVIVIATLQVANAIMAEAALSFLGLGMPVTQPSLGSLIRSGFEFIFSGAWWITLFPSLVLIVLILAINLLGDFLRDGLNPKFRSA